MTTGYILFLAQAYRSGDLSHVLRIVQMMVSNGFFGQTSYLRAAMGEWGESGDDMFKFTDECLARVEDFLRAHLAEVLAVRDLLLEKKELPGDEVIALLNTFKEAK